MNAYIKFWLAKELAGLLVFVGIIAVIAGFVTIIALTDQVERWKKARQLKRVAGEKP